MKGTVVRERVVATLLVLDDESMGIALAGINGNGKRGYKWVSVEKAQRREKELPEERS